LLFILYFKDHENAITLLINGSHWDEALRLINKHKRPDFLESSLIPAVKESFEEYIDLIYQKKITFLANKTRLIEARKEKKEKRLREELGIFFNF
jgi:elongator complex protein 1